MGQSIFSERLRQRMDAKGLSGYKVAIESGIHQQTISALLKGTRGPTEHVIRGLEKVAGLELTYDELKAWWLLDQVGDEGIEAIKKFAPEVLVGLEPREVEQFDVESFAEAKFPPTPEERELINRGLALDVRYGEVYRLAFWNTPPEERREDLIFLEGLVRKAELKTLRTSMRHRKAAV